MKQILLFGLIIFLFSCNSSNENYFDFDELVHYNIEIDESILLEAGQSIKIIAGTRVQYSNPFSEPCTYLSICKPAFHLKKVHREEV